MSQTIKLKKGFNINLAGKAEKKIVSIETPETFAVKPADFQSITRPKVLVKEGDQVKAGTPLFLDKAHEMILYTAPISGEIVEVKRGPKRKLLEIKILADKVVEFEMFKSHSVSEIASLSKEFALEVLLKSGAWPFIIQRPFGIVADPEATPKAIFISGYDTNPLAPDPAFLLEGKDQYFQAGIDILRKFTSGLVHLNIDGNAEVAQIFSLTKNVQLNKFSGPHPAGNVGVQIHHLAPISKGQVVWTISPVGVAVIGKLFMDGKFDTSRRVAITGSEIKTPHYVQTFLGACVNKLVANNVKSDHVRYISGNVLTGENVGIDGYLGFYANQVTVIPEGDQEEFFGWLKPTTEKLSFHRALGLFSFLSPSKEFVIDTNTHGEQRGFVMTGTFEQVLPMDILPNYLFKSIIANDYDDMEALGIYELIEEDVALCEFVDVSKNDLQHLLREGIELIRNS